LEGLEGGKTFKNGPIRKRLNLTELGQEHYKEEIGNFLEGLEKGGS